MSLRRKKIIIDGEVLVMPHFSGIGHYTLELVRAVDKQLPNYPEIQVTIFVHFRHVEKAKAFGLKNIKIIKSPFSLRIANGLKIRGKQPPLDLLFGRAIYVFPNYSSWPLLFSKSVSFIYDLSFEKYPQFAEPRNQAFLSTQVRKSAERAVQIATISKNSAKEIHEFYNVPLRKIGLYYPAVDKSVFYPRDKQEIKSAKDKYGILGDYILFVGNIEPRKNLKNLLLAYEKLDEATRKKYSLLLIGAKGWQDGEIFTIIKRLRAAGNRIQRPNGYVDDKDLPALYSGASVFVYPSIYEGFGIPPIEAMACGVPTVTSNNSSLPEAVGEAAITVDALDIKQISSALYKVLNNSATRARLKKRGSKQADMFSWNDSAINLLDALRKIG